MNAIDIAFGSERSHPNPRSMLFILSGIPIPLQRVRFSGDHCWDSQKHSKLLVSLALEAQLKAQDMFSGALHVDFVFVFPLAKKLSKVKKEKTLDKPHITIPDLDNCIKFYLDCCNKLLFKDDCIVAVISARKIYGAPRTEMTIKEIV